MSKILAFTADQLDRSLFKDGFCPASNLNLEALQTEFIERKPFAEDPANGYIHFIPYILVRDGERVFKYERSSKGGEARLHAMCSVGVGGHVDYSEEIDGELNYLSVLDTASKELAEELNIDSFEEEFELLGYIYDDSDEVGKVHLGIILSYDIVGDEDPLRGGEEDIVVGREWITVADADKFNFENWSKIALKCLQ